jgi:hypothetical protein
VYQIVHSPPRAAAAQEELPIAKTKVQRLERRAQELEALLEQQQPVVENEQSGTHHGLLLLKKSFQFLGATLQALYLRLGRGKFSVSVVLRDAKSSLEDQLVSESERFAAEEGRLSAEIDRLQDKYSPPRAAAAQEELPILGRDAPGAVPSSWQR